MSADLFPHQAIAWLLTYLLHSTLLLGLAWLASKPLGRWSVAAEEAVWKLALVGALFTASLQLAAGWEPAAGRWNLPVAARTAAAAPAFAMPIAAVSEESHAAPGPQPAEERRMPLPSLRTLALGAWALGGGFLLLLYGRSHLRLRSRLRHRPRVVGGTLLSRLRALTAEVGLEGDVRLSCSSRVPVPLALGLSRSEICLPPRALAALSDEQQEGMLAHELAHLVRRDPLWLIVSHVLTCLFFFQPLHWVARRRLREISEMLSDEWAVGRTGRPLSLAGCLAEVAGWSTAGRELPVPGMADRQSHLARRIRRLLDASRSPESPARRVWLGAAMVVVLIGVAAAAPAISAARQEASVRAETPVVEEIAEPAAVAVAEAAEPAAIEEPQEHDVAEEPVAREDGEDDPDQGYGFDDDYDFDDDYSYDFDFDADEIADQAVESVTAALDALDLGLSGLSEMRTLSDEEQEKLEEEIERANDEIERTLEPRIEQLSRELSEKLSRQIPTPEMRRLEEEMEKLAEQMRPSAEEMARWHAQMDEEMRKLRADGELSREERRKMADEARRMARELKPSEEQRKAMEELRRRHHELSRQFMTEHNAEIEKATREMREQVQQQMQAVREEVRRSMEQRRKLQQEERRERQREIRKDREREREEGEAKPPKVSVRIDPGSGVTVNPAPHPKVVVQVEDSCGN